MRIAGVEKAHNESIARQFVHKVDMDARRGFIRNSAPAIVLIAMTIFCCIFVEGFMTWRNLSNLFYQMTIPLVLATGLTFVLLIGSIDLSLEGVIGFAAALTALGVTNSINDNDFGIFAIIVVVLAGTCFGVINGFIHVKMRIPSFMTTYAMGVVIRGIGLLFYKGTPATVK
ncbi:MAG: hypothetical protein Q4D04_16065, partial [Clostridia bacterium]|nr:hypothetical protein [Clostridia bacterium]